MSTKEPRPPRPDEKIADYPDWTERWGGVIRKAAAGVGCTTFAELFLTHADSQKWSDFRLWKNMSIAAVKEVGLRLEVLAVATGKSYSAVYRYSTGTRTPSSEWLAQVAAIVAVEKGRAA